MTTRTTNRREPNKPALQAYSVTGEGQTAFWTRIGSAFAHESGEGLTIKLNAYPINDRIVLLPPKPEDAPDSPKPRA